jgi:hypothetical protein
MLLGLIMTLMLLLLLLQPILAKILTFSLRLLCAAPRPPSLHWEESGACTLVHYAVEYLPRCCEVPAYAGRVPEQQ